MRVLFVCLGNICRSPTAEGIMLHLLKEHNLSSVDIDSAGTSAYHIGETADERSQQEASRHGIYLPSRARQFVIDDFDRFDVIVAMDTNNRADILSMARNEEDRRKVYLLRDFDTATAKGLSVPDPYYENNFSTVFDVCQSACLGLLTHILSLS